MHVLLIIIGCLVCLTNVSAQPSITIYNQDLGLVREKREVEYPVGTGEIRFTNVASQIIPTSVSFVSDRAVLLEQNYEYDLVDQAKLLQKYLDMEVQITTKSSGVVTGTLLSADGAVILRTAEGKISSIYAGEIVSVHFSALPEGLITRPTLVWKVQSKKGGKGSADISYMTTGISWIADYVAVVSADEKNLALTGWVSITNNSGTAYQDATIKLMAGDVRINPREDMARDGWPEMLTMAKSAGGGFEEESFYEYHLYTLGRPSTILNAQIKQIALFDPATTPIKKVYRYNAFMGDKKVAVSLDFLNSTKNNLGMPLPKGTVRVYQESSNGGMEFVGEDRIDHTPKDERVIIETGNAFDIVGERVQNDTRTAKNRTEYEYTTTIRNHKKESVDVLVTEQFWGDWELIGKTTSGWEKKSATQVEWKVTVKPDEEKSITYRVLIKHL